LTFIPQLCEVFQLTVHPVTSTVCTKFSQLYLFCRSKRNTNPFHNVRSP